MVPFLLAATSLVLAVPFCLVALIFAGLADGYSWFSTFMPQAASKWTPFLNAFSWCVMTTHPDPKLRLTRSMLKWALPFTQNPWLTSLYLKIRPLYLLQWVQRLAPARFAEFPILLARVKCFDHAVQRYGPRLDQLVILGAGCDTRGSRLRDDLAKDCRVFEVDLPDTQRFKRQIISERLPGAQEGVTYLSVDFNDYKENPLDKALLEAGFEPAKRTLFLLEGVTYYLPAGTIEALLESIAKLGRDAMGVVPPDSQTSLIFNYVHEDVRTGTATSDTGKLLMSNPLFGAPDSKEPWVFGLSGNEFELKKWVQARGFDLATFYSPHRLIEEFASYSDGRKWPYYWTFISVAVVQVASHNAAVVGLPVSG